MLIENTSFIYNSIAKNTADTPLTAGLMSAINQQVGASVRCLFAEDQTTLYIMMLYQSMPWATQERLRNFLEKAYGITAYPVTCSPSYVTFPAISATISKEKQEEVIILLKMQGHIS